MPNAPASFTRPQPLVLAPSLIAGRYEIEREIGRGGAGIVCRARDCDAVTAIAIKVLRPELATPQGNAPHDQSADIVVTYKSQRGTIRCSRA